MKRPWLAGMLAALPLLASAVTQIQDDAGRTTQWAKPPQRIVSLLPSLTETVCALGDCERLVGVDRYSNHPAQVRRLPQLGGIDDLQVEAIVALRPDVVIAAPSSRVNDRLLALGLPVVTLDAKSFADAQRVISKTGALLGREAEAAQLWRRIEADVGAAAQSVGAGVNGQRAYYEVAAGPYAAGPSSFMGELMSKVGARNIITAAMGPFPKINPEFVVRANPQVIMISQREAQGLAQRPGWQAIEAIRKGRVCVFTTDQGDILARPGPRMAEGAQLMAACLNGTLKP